MSNHEVHMQLKHALHKDLGKTTMNSILFSNQKPTNGKKGKSHKMYVFAQDIGIRNLVKILLVSTTLRSQLPFSTAKKTWSKVLPILLLKYNPKSNAYPLKKECPNPIIISSNMGIGNLVKETLASTPYINPPFTFPAPREKHKCISASASTGPASVRTHSHLHVDATNVREKNNSASARTHSCIRADGEIIK
jgi:hypothetical protein